MNLWFDDDPERARQACALWRHGPYNCYAITHLLGIALDYGRHHRALLDFLSAHTLVNARVIKVAAAWLRHRPEIQEHPEVRACVNI